MIALMINLMHFIHVYGQAGMFLIVFLESSFFFPLPGDSLLFTAGLFATKGFLHIWTIIPLFFFATFFGSLLGYEIGARVVYLNRFKLFRKLVSEHHLKQVHDFFQKYGKVSLLFARFVPIVRTFAPIGAGIGKMKYSDFVKFNIIGAFIWSTSVTFMGYFLGKTFPGIQHYLSVVVIVVIIVSVVPPVFHILNKKRK
jgi:membrane-associated protein